jgi:hypothetical protein
MPHPAGRDLRAYARSTQVRLALGGLLLMVLVGNGLIWWIYGPAAVRASLLCTAVGLGPVVLIVIGLELLAFIARKAGKR